jgi:3-hydroxyisobutyrate dehydrogenase
LKEFIMAKLKVALMGLGIMGSGMARRILGGGFPLAVYNRTAERAEALGAEGAFVAASPKEAAKDADVIICIVADDIASRNLWMGENGAQAGAKRGAVLVESSTVTGKWIHELSDAAKSKGCELLDAPVTGSKPQAAAGELGFLVGGEASTLEKARPVLEVMSKKIFHLGPLGSGVILKLINNFMCGVQLITVAEAMSFIERSGLDREQALAMLTAGNPGSPFVKAMTARMSTGNYEPNFLLRLMSKDMRYAIAEAERFSLDLSSAAAALGVLEQAVSAGLGERDLSAVVELFRKKNRRD